MADYDAAPVGLPPLGAASPAPSGRTPDDSYRRAANDPYRAVRPLGYAPAKKTGKRTRMKRGPA